MNRIIFHLFAVGFCFAVVQTLKCYKCTIGIGELCLTTETTCASGEQCYSGIGKAAGFLDVTRKGCLAVANCNKTEDVNFPISGSNGTALYTMTKTCCNTDLCNAAPGLPGASGLSLALATITALFVSKALV